MKIVHIISTLNIGGAENFVVQLANAQAQTHQVVIIVLQSSNPEHNYIKAVSDTIQIIPLHWKKKYSISQLIQLYRTLKTQQPQVIHAHLHNALYYTYGVSFAYKKSNYIHTVHSCFDNWKTIFSWLHRWSWLNNRITHICLTPRIHKQVQTTFPKLKSNLITNGIVPYSPRRTKDEIAIFWNSFTPISQKGIRFLAIGNINRHKNFQLLSRSLINIREQYPEVICVQIGRPVNPKLTTELEIINAPNVFLAGGQEHAADFLTEADALLITSIEEGMPIVALEAMSMGVPIITTPAGGMPDLVQNEYNGIIAENFTVEAFEKAILNFIHLPITDRKILAHNAKKHFTKHYEITQTKKTYLKQYTENVLD